MELGYGEFIRRTTEFRSKFLKSNTVTKAFRKCSSDVDRYRFVVKFLKRNDWKGVGEFVSYHASENEKDFGSAEAARRRGNKAFAENRMKDALNEYNKAVRRAPWSTSGTGNICLALAFGNRSAVMYRLGRFVECVVEVDRAVASGFPSAKMKTLLVRKVEALCESGRFAEALDCLKKDFSRFGLFFENESSSQTTVVDADASRLYKRAASSLKHQKEEGPKPDPYYPTATEMRVRLEELKLAGGPHQVFKSASSLVDFKYDLEVGRHFVAGGNIAAGDVLLMEPYFVGFLKDERIHTNCSVCLVYTETPYPCDTCSSVVFCSEICAKNTKPIAHAQECRFLRALRESDVSSYTVPVRRTVLSKSPDEWRQFAARPPGDQLWISDFSDVYKSLPNPECYESDDYDNVFCLQRRPSEPMFEQEVLFAFVSVFLIQFLEQVHFKPGDLDDQLRGYLGGLALRHLWICSLNFAPCNDAVFLRSNPGVAATLALNKLCPRHFEPVPGVSVPSHSSAHTGYVLHPTLALFNSACNGNLEIVHFGDVAVLFALRPIKKGEVLSTCTSTFDFFTATRTFRREYTMLLFGYLCSCRPCTGNWAGNATRFLDESEKFSLHCPECGYKFPDVAACKRSLSRRQGKCPGCGQDVLKRIEAVVTESKWPPTSPDDRLLPFFNGDCFKVLEEPHLNLSRVQNNFVPVLFRNKGNRRYFEDEWVMK